MTTITINGHQYQAERGEKVIKVLFREDIDIPHLCYHEALAPYGSCRLCVVEIKAGGRLGITASCTLPVADGLTVETDSHRVKEIRKVLLEMYLAEAPASPEIQALAEQYGVDTTRFKKCDIAASGDRCVLCGLCARICSETIGIGAIDYTARSIHSRISPPWFELSEVCIGCGSCVMSCPTGAITSHDAGNERAFEVSGSVFSRHTLVQCEQCQRSFVTEKYLAHMRKVSADKGEAVAEKQLCLECIQNQVAAEFMPRIWRKK